MATDTFQIVEGPYLCDILDQPRALTATLEQLEISSELARLAAALRSGKIRRILMTGMGASFHALHPLFLQLNAHAFTALAVETSELVHSLENWFEPQTLIIAVSQSGQSAEVVRMIEENRGRAAIVGVTNVADSPLARRANALILTKAGAEFSVSCKTYVTVLMALHLLGGFLCGCDPNKTREDLARIIPAAAGYLRGWKEHTLEMANEIEPVRHIFFLGRGSSLAAAGEGALIVKESVRLYAEAMSGAAFRHGPLEMVSSETFAVVFAGPEATRGLQAKLREDIRDAGGRTAWITQEAGRGPWHLPRTPENVSPMLEILPIQMMTLAIAANVGVEAGRFARIPKITTTE